MEVVQGRVLITTPAQNAMEGHGLTDALLIIGSDAELYPRPGGAGDMVPRAVAYSVYCPATKRYSVVTLDGRWVIPGAEGYKSRGPVTAYVRKNVDTLRPEGLVILEPVRHNGPFTATQFGRRKGKCRGALGYSTGSSYFYDCSCGATVQPDKVRRMGWVIVRDGRGSHTVSYALDRSHAREFGTVPTEVPETANVVVAGAPAPVDPAETTPARGDAPKITDIVFTGRGGNEYAEILGHSYTVSLIEGTYLVTHGDTCDEVADFVKGRLAMKRVILADAVERGPVKPEECTAPEPDEPDTTSGHVTVTMPDTADQADPISFNWGKGQSRWYVTASWRGMKFLVSRKGGQFRITRNVRENSERPSQWAAADRVRSGEGPMRTRADAQAAMVAHVRKRQALEAEALRQIAEAETGNAPVWKSTLDKGPHKARRMSPEKVLAEWGDAVTFEVIDESDAPSMSERKPTPEPAPAEAPVAEHKTRTVSGSSETTAGTWKYGYSIHCTCGWSRWEPNQGTARLLAKSHREQPNPSQAGTPAPEAAPVVSWQDAVRGEPITIGTPKGTVEVRYAGFESVCRWDCQHYEEECPCLPRPVMLCDGEGEPYPWEDCPECMAKKLDVSPEAVRAALPSADPAEKHPPLIGPLRMSLEWEIEELEPGYERVIYLGQEFRILSNAQGLCQPFRADGQRMCGRLAWPTRESALSNIEGQAFFGVPREAMRLVRLHDETRVHCVMCEPGYAWGRGKSKKAVVEIAGAGEVFVCDGPFHLGMLDLVPEQYTEGLSGDQKGSALAQYAAWVGGQGERPLTLAERTAQQKQKKAGGRAVKAAAKAKSPGGAAVKAPRVGDITFAGAKGQETAEVLGHAYQVSTLAGRYTAVHVASGARVCEYETSRPAMKRAILADAVRRGQAPQGGVARVTPSAEVVDAELIEEEDTPNLRVGDLAVQRFAEMTKEQVGEVRRLFRNGSWLAEVVRTDADGQEIVLLENVDHLAKVTPEQLAATRPTERLENGQHRGWLAQALVTRHAGKFRVTCMCLPSVEICREGRRVGWCSTVEAARALWEWHTAGEVGPAPEDTEAAALIKSGKAEHTHLAPRVSVPVEAMSHAVRQWTEETEQLIARNCVVTGATGGSRCYLCGRWHAFLVEAEQDGVSFAADRWCLRDYTDAHEQCGADVEDTAATYAGRSWSEIVDPGKALCEEQAAWERLERLAYVAWWAERTEVEPLAGLGCGWSTYQHGEPERYAVEVTTDHGITYRVDTRESLARPFVITLKNTQTKVAATTEQSEVYELIRQDSERRMFAEVSEHMGPRADTAEKPSDPVVVFIASENTRPARMRVLWKVTRAEAMTICSDSRSAGRNHMLCWTADPGTEGEDWEWAKDTGSYAALLAELGVVPVRTWGQPEPEVILTERPSPSGGFSYQWDAQIGGDDRYSVTGDCQGKVKGGVPAHTFYRVHWAHGQGDELNVWALGNVKSMDAARDVIRDHWRRSQSEDACTVAQRMYYASELWILPEVGDGESITYHAEHFWTITSAEGHRYQVTKGGRKWLTYRGDDLHVHYMDGEAPVYVGQTTEHYEKRWPQMLSILREHSADLAARADTKEIPAGVPAGSEVKEIPPADTEDNPNQGPVVRYNPNSVIVPETAPEILAWAACHIENVGLYQGDGLFNRPGRGVELACHPRGAVSVAAGNGRFASGRTYDHAAIQAAEREALRLLAEHVTGQPVETLTDSAAVRACYWRPIDEWGMVEGRTAAEVAEAMRAAATGEGGEASSGADTEEKPGQGPAGCDEVPDSSPADTDAPEGDQDGEALRYHQGGCDGETKWLYVQAEGVARMLRHFLACDCGGAKLGNFGRSAPAMDSGTLRKPKGIRQADIQGADALADRNSYDRTGPFVVLDEVTKRAPVEWRHAEQEIRVVVDPNSAAQPRALERERADTEPAQAPDPAMVERLAKEIRIRESYRIGDEQKRAAYKLAGERIREARRRSHQPEPEAPAVAEGESIKPMNPGWAQEWWLFADVYGYRYEVSHRSGRWHGMARFDESQGEGGVTLPGNLVPVVKSGCATAEELLELCREIGRKRARQDAGSRMLERLTGKASASTTPQDSMPADTAPEARSTFAALLKRHHGKDWRPLCTGYAGSEGGELEDVDQDETKSQEPPQGIASISRKQRSAAWRIAAGESQPSPKPEPAAGSAPQNFQIADTAQEERTVKVLATNMVGRRLRQVRPARKKLVGARRKAATFVRETLPPAAARVRATGQEIAKAVQARIHKPARPTASLHIPAEPTTPVMPPAPAPVPVEKALCDAHIARDGSQVEATEALTLGERSWDLCPEHAERFGNLLEEKAQPLTLGNRAWNVWSDHAEQFAALLVDVLGEPGERAMAGMPDADVQQSQEHDAGNEEPGEKTFEAEPAGPEQPSVMLTGEVPGYSWDDARQALRNAGYRVAGRADDTTVLIICGEGAEKNATKLRDAREYSLPCMDVRDPGRFRDAVRAGEFVGGDPLPESAKAVSSG
ncbi:DUF6197 family protein, partial [Streptomyces syringium]|uniref:DUF6197 family protein n=1 Tax=Streptomyces syringium TaxID=76729 RepID=UPI0033F1237F